MNKFLLGSCLSFIVAVAGAAEAGGTSNGTQNGDAANGQPVAGQDADNSGVNKRDRADATVTPPDQGFAEADRKVLQAARRALTKDDTLSTNAHNVKLVIKDGHATLRGPVTDAAERARVCDIVKNTDGVSSVDDQLDVKTP